MVNPDHDRAHVETALCAVVTISDTRTRQTDAGGPLIVEALTNAGHKVAAHDILPDDLLEIRRHVEALCSKGLDAIITTGGTGIAARDQTPEALLPLLEKRLDGFAELFRWLSVQEVGPVATLSRAFAGTWGKTIIFSLPGSPKAVRLAMERLILPILPHAVALLRT